MIPRLNALLIQLSANPYFDLMTSYNVGQLGLYYLAKYADDAGYNVKVKAFNSFDDISIILPNLIELYNCKIIGFYVDSDNLWAIRSLTPILHKSCPNVKIIIGGPQVTGDPYGTIQLIPNVTCGIIGEGEVQFLKLLQLDTFSENNLNSIEGIIYNTLNGLNVTKPQKQIKNLDNLGFPKREKYCLDPDKVSFSQIISGRGCMGKCAFCYEGGQEHSNLRIRSIDSCLEEIDYLVNIYGTRYINFVDDTFILNRKRTEKLCLRMIEKYNGKIKWYCEARADILSKNIDILPLLKKAGLVKIQLGGESGNQEILDVYKKGITIEQLEYVTKEIANAGIPYIYINFIIGGAFETEKTFNNTLSFAKKLINMSPGRVEVSSSVFTPTPGSPMYMHPDKFGLKIIDKRAIRGASCSFVFAETETLNQYKIWQLRNKFNNEIDNTYNKLLNAIPRQQLYEMFDLSINYNIKTPWTILLERNAIFRNYFEPIIRGSFYCFDDIAKSNNHNLLSAVPYRTTHLSSDGVAFYRTSKCGKIKKNSDLENAIITLSAGKLPFNEIFNIIKSSKISELNDNDLLNQCFNIYKNFDEDLLVVWKTY